MAITSVSKSKSRIRYQSTHFRYAITYVFVTFAVLLFLNIYSMNVSQALIYKSRESSMIERCLLASAEIAELEILNSDTVTDAVSNIDNTRVTRLIITDQNGAAIYDSKGGEQSQQFVLLPEVVLALKGNDVFTWDYTDGAMRSKAATPIYAYGTLIGCVYMMEYDEAQGAVIQSLQKNTLTITIILEIAVIIFSLIFSRAFSRRLKRIMVSMRIIRSGDYTHKVEMGGHDELTVLGEEFNDLVERLQTSEQKRNNFVSDASHELKTPLASIKLLSDSILQNDMDIDTVREFVGDIGNEADRLNRMSQKLLSLSRIESQADSDCEIVYIGPTIDRVVRMLSVLAEAQKITVETHIDEDCPILILEDDLYQIIFNLTENGIKYNTPGGVLRIILQREDDNAVLAVNDSGVGIPQDSLDHIFERFYRVDKGRSRKSGGSGLGLSIVRNMVERNGGSIKVDSTVGQGSTFTITFPAFDVEDTE